jgi:hypothetical protein
MFYYVLATRDTAPYSQDRAQLDSYQPWVFHPFQLAERWKNLISHDYFIYVGILALS